MLVTRHQSRIESPFPRVPISKGLVNEIPRQSVGESMCLFENSCREGISFYLVCGQSCTAKKTRCVSKRAIEIRSTSQTHPLPLGRMTADLIQFSACQFHQQTVWLFSFAQGTRRNHKRSKRLDRPRHNEVTTLVLCAPQSEATGTDFNLGRYGCLVEVTNRGCDARLRKRRRSDAGKRIRQQKRHRPHVRAYRLELSAKKAMAQAVSPTPPGPTGAALVIPARWA